MGSKKAAKVMHPVETPSGQRGRAHALAAYLSVSTPTVHIIQTHPVESSLPPLVQDLLADHQHGFQKVTLGLQGFFHGLLRLALQQAVVDPLEGLLGVREGSGVVDQVFVHVITF